MKTSRVIAITLPVVLFSVSLVSAATTTSPQTSAYQDSFAQDQLRGQAKRVKEEMLQMLEEFRQDPAAAAEVAQAQAALDQLGTLSDKDMLAVVQTLRDASHLNDAQSAKNKLLSASSGQKNIQSLLRSLADKLTLHKDESSMQQRLRDLVLRQVANQRLAKDFAAAGGVPFDLRATGDISIAEQNALKTEVDQAMETLQKLASNTTDSTSQTFAAVLMSGQNLKISDQAAAAASNMTAKNFANAIPAQGQVIESLQAMIAALNSTKSQEEQVRAMLNKVNELAAGEKQEADSTVKAFVDNQAYLKDKQLKLTDQMTAIQKEIARLNAQAGTQANAARGKMDSVDQMFKDRVFIDKIENKTQAVQAQTEATDQLKTLAKMLEKQADDMAKASGNNMANPSAMTAQQSALADAISQILDAKTKMAMAKNIAWFKGDAAAAQAQMKGAADALADAQAKAAQAAQAGQGVPKDVGDSLKSAQSNLAGSQNKLAPGGNRESGFSDLDQAQRDADKALAGLRTASDKAFGQSAWGKGEGLGMESGSNGPGGGGQIGGTALSRGQRQLTNFSAVAEMSPKDRAALSLLQREKCPPEYSTMVQQYLKNLADGEMPAQ